jgi:hypothetical protein
MLGRRPPKVARFGVFSAGSATMVIVEFSGHLGTFFALGHRVKTLDFDHGDGNMVRLWA